MFKRFAYVSRKPDPKARECGDCAWLRGLPGSGGTPSERHHGLTCFCGNRDLAAARGSDLPDRSGCPGWTPAPMAFSLPSFSMLLYRSTYVFPDMPGRES